MVQPRALSQSRVCRARWVVEMDVTVDYALWCVLRCPCTATVYGIGQWWNKRYAATIATAAAARGHNVSSPTDALPNMRMKLPNSTSTARYQRFRGSFVLVHRCGHPSVELVCVPNLRLTQFR